MKIVREHLLCWLLIILATPQLFGQISPEEPIARSGTLDLRKVDLKDRHYFLRGEWNFYPDLLLTQNQLSAHPRSTINYPALWSKNTGTKNSSQGVATYSLIILLPHDRPKLALKVPEAFSAYTLFANGEYVSSNGKPGISRETSKPFWEARTVNLANTADTIHLIMQVANYWHYKGGTSEDILIGERNVMYLERNRSHALDLLLAGCLFMGGLFFLGLFIFGPQDKSILYFSLFCIVYSYRMIGTGDYVLHGVLPDLSWFLTVRLEYLTLVAGVGLFGKYTYLLYPQYTRKLVVDILLVLCAIYSCIILIATPAIFTAILPWFLAVMFLYIAFASNTYLQAMRHKSSGSGFALISSGVMVLIFLLINLQYFHIVIPAKGITFTLYIAFFFLQSLVLSHRFSLRLKDAADQAQEGLKTKSEFLSTMSHEIRTPLNSVIGMAHLLQRSNVRKDQQENFEVLLFSAKNLLSIVNNILDYNKIEAGRIHFEKIKMDIPSIAKNILAGLKTIAVEKRIALSLIIDDRLTQYVMGDPTRTAQVLNNLVHNGLKFTTAGSVELEVKIERSGEKYITLLFSVTDTGIGIPFEKQQMILERFTQADSSTSRKYGGTGLGLSISQKILELQGTGLAIRSEPGKGSTFSFSQRFELTGEKLVAEQVLKQNSGLSERPFKGVNILLVEDNPMNVLVARTFLERSGAVIDVAVNGQEAIDIFDEQKHSLILMDLDMPVMDGYEATRLLRLQGQTVPIIALTASLPNEVQLEVNQAGLSDIMVKPFHPDDLQRIILQHL